MQNNLLVARRGPTRILVQSNQITPPTGFLDDSVVWVDLAKLKASTKRLHSTNGFSEISFFGRMEKKGRWLVLVLLTVFEWGHQAISDFQKEFNNEEPF